AERCGIPQSSVVRMETMKTRPKLDTLIKITQALNLKLQLTVPAS
ncbi:MAG: helix-turn-helix transcriptional regulator, partial [Megasphaera sp.]|nr:helix-turn-helix transcriptional regulator [Megasphaera sp.]